MHLKLILSFADSLTGRPSLKKRGGMKETIAAILMLLIALSSFGCADGKEFKATPVVLSKKAPEAPPVPLDQIIAANDAALTFAGEKYDALGEDRYLSYVVDAKDRDAEDRAKATAEVLKAATAEAEAQVNSASQSSVSVNTNETNSNNSSSNGGSSGESPNNSAENDPGSEPSGSSSRYYNLNLGYSIEFPNGWVSGEAEVADYELVAAINPVAGSDNKLVESIGVAVQGLPAELTAAEYMDMAVIGLKAGMQDFKELSRSDFTIDGRGGKKLVFTYSADGKTMKDALYEFVDGTIAYVIVGTSDDGRFSTYEGKFDVSAGSFRLEN